MRDAADDEKQGAKEPVVNPISGEVSNPDHSDAHFPLPVLASKARHDLSPEKSKLEDLMEILTCGDAGGEVVDPATGEREACDYPSSYGIPYTKYGITPGRCFYHTEQELGRKAKKKAMFLAAYTDDPLLGVKHAADLAGVDQKTIYFWAQADREFANNFEMVRRVATEMQTDEIEDVAAKRLANEDKNADTLRQWWLVNRRPGKWKTPGKIDQGGPVNPNISGGNHIWLMGNGQKESW